MVKGRIPFYKYTTTFRIHSWHLLSFSWLPQKWGLGTSWPILAPFYRLLGALCFFFGSALGSFFFSFSDARHRPRAEPGLLPPLAPGPLRRQRGAGRGAQAPAGRLLRGPRGPSLRSPTFSVFSASGLELDGDGVNSNKVKPTCWFRLARLFLEGTFVLGL